MYFPEKYLNCKALACLRDMCNTRFQCWCWCCLQYCIWDLSTLRLLLLKLYTNTWEKLRGVCSQSLGNSPCYKPHSCMLDITKCRAHDKNLGSSGCVGVMQRRVGSNLQILMIPPFYYYHWGKHVLRLEVKFPDTLSAKPIWWSFQVI